MSLDRNGANCSGADGFASMPTGFAPFPESELSEHEYKEILDAKRKASHPFSFLQGLELV